MPRLWFARLAAMACRSAMAAMADARSVAMPCESLEERRRARPGDRARPLVLDFQLRRHAQGARVGVVDKTERTRCVEHAGDVAVVEQIARPEADAPLA